MISRFITTILAIILILYGVIAAISPLPLGLPLIALGVVMIAAANPRARPLLRKMRKNWGWFDKLLKGVWRRSPPQLKEVLEETRPEQSTKQTTAPDEIGDEK